MVAGEVSGDAHGAGLIRSLRKNHDSADIFGIGGKQMLREGFRPTSCWTPCKHTV